MVAIVRDQGTVFTNNTPGEPQTRMRIAQDWTPAADDKKPQKVFAFSNAEEVELSLNGKSLGSQKRPKDGAQRVWTVPYAPGTLTAVARNGGKEVARDELRTAGKAAKIILKTDHDQLSPLWDDVSFITATIVDERGTVVLSASDQITFAVDGPGKVAVVENGDTNSHEPFQATQRRAFQGLCTAVIRATATSGKIHLTATAPGLASASIELQAVEAKHN
jgi:beta-galactosidase